MKLTPRTKKLLTIALFAIVLITLSGCAVPRNEDGSIVLITNSTTFTEMFKNESWFSAIFVYPMAWVINHLSGPIGVGGAIALVTAVVNTLLAAATLNATVSQQKMQMVQPELDKITRKYEGRDDENSKMRMAAEQQALLRKHNINPGSMLLLTFLQFPVIIAIYMAVQRSEAVQTGAFMGMNLRTTVMNGIKSAFAGDSSGWAYLGLFIVMIILHACSMLIPQYLQKKKAEEVARKHHRKPEEPSNQNKFMQYYMIGMIAVFGLMLPAAMSLYWSINSVVQIVKTVIVQNIIDKKEEGSKK